MRNIYDKKISWFNFGACAQKKMLRHHFLHTFFKFIYSFSEGYPMYIERVYVMNEYSINRMHEMHSNRKSPNKITNNN